MALNLNYNLNKEYLKEIKNKNSLHVRYKIRKDISNLIVKPNKLLLFIFCLSLITVLFLHHSSVKTELYLNNLQIDIVKITQNNDSLNIKLEKEKNLDKVEKLAKENLGMRQITNSEITYLQSIKVFNKVKNNINKNYENYKIEIPLGY
jgi:cell division protein FtsL